ncbi:MAG TPA: polysaccharide biosynthesis/export family protein [Blastocatellia bacterium]|nr:polysaccharide biosynthesis/export family protein [Blastocatellia bacterium]
MKSSVTCHGFTLAALLIVLLALPTAAQEAGKKSEPQKPKTAERMSPDEGVPQKDEKSLSDADRQAGRRELETEAEAELQPYFNNYFRTLRFGPQDVVSVLVFNHDKYSMLNVTIPPDGRLNYPLIGQVVMVGRTAEDVQREIADKLSEYIIEPKVTVQIVQTHSLKYMVLGDVNKPGVYEMNRRMSLMEAIAEAGDVTRFGDRAKISVLRQQTDGSIRPYPVDLKKMQSGRGSAFFLSPGDVVVVPGNKYKTIDKVVQLLTMGSLWRTIAYPR